MELILGSASPLGLGRLNDLIVQKVNNKSTNEHRDSGTRGAPPLGDKYWFIEDKYQEVILQVGFEGEWNIFLLHRFQSAGGEYWECVCSLKYGIYD